MIGGCDVVQVAAEYGTPLYVYDEATIRARARAYRDALQVSYASESLVCYAGKAYCAPWLLRVLAEEQLGLDVVSGGELYTARSGGFPMERVFFHGNNKSEDELWMALEAGVHAIVVDNLEEIERLARLATDRVMRQKVLLRVAPGVEAHTHAHILTGAPDTKFGVSIDTGAAREAAEAIHQARSLEFVGLHAHIGSQIFEIEPYQATIGKVFGLAAELRDAFGFVLKELSPGGGFGMRYTSDGEAPMAPAEAARALAQAVTSEAERFGFPMPRLTIEPGRSIIGPSAVALYRVGSIKPIPGVRTYVAVDGGMADNIRPATYGARYTALLANKANEPSDKVVTISGSHCESGDVLIRDVALPSSVGRGDLLAILATGAYGYAMASNYNKMPRPAVIGVRDGSARVVVRRETYEDLIRLDGA